MKVTKIVREFVEEEVNKKYPIPELDKVAVAQLDKEIFETKSRILEEAGELIFKKMKEAGLQLTEGVVGIEIDHWIGRGEQGRAYYNCVINNLQKAYDDACRIIEAKRERAIKDILVTLELGGTKKELTEMLANLPD